MKVHPLATVIPPAQVSEDPLLLDGPRQVLNGGTSVLLLAWINDRLGSEFIQHPAHPVELRSLQREAQFVSPDLSFEIEFA